MNEIEIQEALEIIQTAELVPLGRWTFSGEPVADLYVQIPREKAKKIAKAVKYLYDRKIAGAL